MKIKSIRNVKNLRGKRVLWRVDYNVPMEKGRILDDYKIMRQMMTLNFLLKNKCKVIIMTHLGRPKSGADNSDFSTKPISKRLSKIINKKVNFVDDCVGLKAGTAVSNMGEGDILMLQNIRFEEGEKKNSKVLAKKMASLADIYVNDAFAVSHREHASVCAIKSYLSSYAGLLLQDEVLHMYKAIKPRKPMVLVIGGAKVATKVKLIDKLGSKSSHILLGGALANNFFVARGFCVGKSLVDDESIALARKLLETDDKRRGQSRIILPIDVIVSENSNGKKPIVKMIGDVGKNDYIFDIGPKTVRLFSRIMKEAKTIIWNGPMGMLESEHYREGTLSMAKIISNYSTCGAFALAGGGETEEALKMSKRVDEIDWVSTGGGAMLSYLGGEKMPGLKILVK